MFLCKYLLCRLSQSRLCSVCLPLLSASVYRINISSPRPRHPPNHICFWKEIFQKYDLNNDKKLSLDEFVCLYVSCLLIINNTHTHTHTHTHIYIYTIYIYIYIYYIYTIYIYTYIYYIYMYIYILYIYIYIFV